MRLKLLCTALVVASTAATQTHAFNAVFSEDFNSVTLGPSVNERVSTIAEFELATRLADDPDFSPRPDAIATSLPVGWSVDNDFDAFGNIDLAFDPFAQGDPALLDLEEGFAPPVGTVIGNAGVPSQGSFDDGVDEWEGWNVASKDFWISVDDQQRSLWTGGTGNVAIADPDEYDDLGEGRNGGYFNSGLSTPQINIPAGNSDLLLNYNYSFRAEAFDDGHNVAGSSIFEQELNNSTAQVWVTYDGTNGGTQTVPGTLIDSDAGNGVVGDSDFRAPSATLATPATFNDLDDSLIDAGDVDGSASVLLPTIPAGASNVQVTFGLLNAGNDWWFAVDNIQVLGDVSGQIFSEDFEGVTLTDSINEQIADVPTFAKVTTEASTPDTEPRPDSFTSTAPAGWTVDNSNMPASNLGDDDVGILEFEGWNFMDLAFWNFADTQDRELFTKAEGSFAVADGDEWDDLNDPTDPPGGLMDTLLESPEIDITGILAGELVLMFDSSWRDEDDNTAVITVDYGNGPVEVLRWESDEASAFFHDDNPNETVVVSLDNPDGATSATVAFQYIGGNDWWWAVDNIQVGTIPEPTSLGLAMLAMLGFVARRNS
ncbi:MAG: PEP-CTERM sorting domain-containing protein [Planctomycetota bacterium]